MVGPGDGGDGRPPRGDPLAVAGFVLGLGGLLIAPLILGLVALVLGVVAFRRIRREPEAYRGRNLAIAAIALGAVDTVAGVLLALAAVGENGPAG